jgi:SecD/SecF fusion protein
VLQNPLRAPLTIEASSKVDPTLGQDSIRSGIKAAIAGTLAVSAFMLVYYMLAGMVANVALLANILILLGVMCSVGTTLTLPGIAGIVLTVGMAVDANVLIYERIREESAKGKSLRGAIAAGYSRAFGTIFDSHVTTLISSVLLIFFGTGPIKGFGVALTIGVAASLFTALVVTRLIFDFLLDRGWLKSIKMLHIIKNTRIDFMKLAKPAFAVSWTLILIGIGYGFYRGSELFGIDFVGGDTTTFAFTKRGESEIGLPRRRGPEIASDSIRA